MSETSFTESFKTNHGLHGLLVGVGTSLVLRNITNYNTIIGIGAGVGTYYFMTRDTQPTSSIPINPTNTQTTNSVPDLFNPFGNIDFSWINQITTYGEPVRPEPIMLNSGFS